MTFSLKVKEEICNREIDRVAVFSRLEAIVRYDAVIKEKGFSFTFESPQIARRVYKDFKSAFNITPHVTVRNQKRFRSKQVYILDIKENAKLVLERLNIIKNNQFLEMNRNNLSDPEEMVSFVEGAF